MRDLDVFQTEGTEELNFKYLDFWLMDPLSMILKSQVIGFINLGNSISEDCPRDDMLANEAIISIWPEGRRHHTLGTFGKEGTDVSFWQEGDEQDFGLDWFEQYSGRDSN